EADERKAMSWYDFTVSYIDHKWPDISAKHRGNIAFALMMATTALLTTEREMPDTPLLRAALRRWAYSKTYRAAERPREVEDALQWVTRNTRAVGELADPKLTDGAARAATRDLEGRKLVV